MLSAIKSSYLNMVAHGCADRLDAGVGDVVRDGAEQAGGGVRALWRKQRVLNLVCVRVFSL